MKTAPSSPNSWSRRRLLKTVFCSSAALGLNLRPDGVSAAESAADDQHWFALGDYGSMQPSPPSRMA
jgi:hypothetical protein